MRFLCRRPPRRVAEVVFEDCKHPGGIREILLPYAIIALCVYTISYPCALFYILYKNRMLVMEDQLLRAEDRWCSCSARLLHSREFAKVVAHARAGRGFGRCPRKIAALRSATPLACCAVVPCRGLWQGCHPLGEPERVPSAQDVPQVRRTCARRFCPVAVNFKSVLGVLARLLLEAVIAVSVPRYSFAVVFVACRRMYYHFRPDYWFWIVVILGRKLMIAVTALMFNKNPAFQMAIALLVLFVCYALQVNGAGARCAGRRNDFV